MGYQPIETAPDDKLIIVGGWCDDGGAQTSWVWGAAVAWWEPDLAKWCDDVDMMSGEPLPCTIDIVVAWMDIPEPGPEFPPPSR